MFSVSFFGEIIIFVKIKDWSSIGISCKYGYQGRPPDLGGGGSKKFFLLILELLGGSGVCSPVKIF